MLVKIVDTVVSTDSAGRPVDAIPIREWQAGETSVTGVPLAAVPLEVSDLGVPVRYVAGKTAQNSVGQWVDSIPTTGGAERESVTGENYPLAWRQDFKRDALSLRRDGPTPAGYAAGKGIWRPADWYMPGVGEFETGYYGFGEDWYVNQSFNFHAVDASWPPLGPLRKTADGLIMSTFVAPPAIQALFPDAYPESATGEQIGRHIAASTDWGDPGGTWFDSTGGTFTVGSAVDGLSAPAVIAVGGASDFAGREFYRGAAAVNGTKYYVSRKFNYGTSGRYRVLFDDGLGATVVECVSGDPTPDVIANGPARVVSTPVLTTVDGHLELSFEITAKNSGAMTFRDMPGTTTNGQTVIVYETSAGTGFTAARPRFPAPLLTGLDSIQVPAPFYISVTATVPGGPYDWSAFWLNTVKSMADPYAQYGEIDFHEFFEEYGSSYAFAALHFSRRRGDVPGFENNYNLYEPTSAVDIGEDIGGVSRIFSAHVEETRIRVFIDEVLFATFTPPVENPVGMPTYPLMDLSAGYRYHGSAGYPVGFEGSSMTVEEMSYYLLPSNTEAVFPTEKPPMPTLVWTIGNEGGVVPGAFTGEGLVLANLSGAATYRVITGFNGVEISGSNLVCSANVPLTPGIYPFYIEGIAASGMPGIANEFTLTVI